MNAPPLIGARIAAQGGLPLPHRRRPVHRRRRAAEPGLRGVRALAARACGDQENRLRGRPRRRPASSRLHRRGPRRRQGRRPALRLADHRRQRPADEGAAASLPRAGQGALRRRPRRGGDRRDARPGARRRRADRGRLRGAAAVVDAAKAAPSRRAASTRSPRTTPATSGRSATRPRRCRFQKAAHVTKLELVNNRLIPNAIEPRAAIGAYSRADDELHALRREPEPARRAAADDRVRARPARAQGARGRARRRRRLRLEDLPLRRGRGGHLGVEAAQPPGEVDRRPQRGLPLRRARPRPRHRRRARARQGRQVPRDAR